MCAKLFLAYAVVPEARHNSRVTQYCEESFGVTHVYSLATDELWEDPRVKYGVHGFELTTENIILSETEQMFVDFVRMVTGRFVELQDAARPAVAELEQHF
jgi:hypothetical protein